METLNNIINLLFIFICFINSIIIFYLLKEKDNQLKNEKQHNGYLQVLYDDVKGFKHDLNNIMHIIGGYIDSNDMKGLKIYYNDLRKDYVKINNNELLNQNTINNPGIYGLITAKYDKACECNVNLSMEIFFDFNNIKISIYEFSRILGILLDNAIEAASECDEKQINLIFRESKKNHIQTVCIENTYKNKSIDTKTIFEKGFSGKENHTGIGLWEVNQIISKNNNVVLHTSKDEKYFKQQLEIYY